MTADVLLLALVRAKLAGDGAAVGRLLALRDDPEGLAQATLGQVREAKDAAGHEHKGKGKGGGQFTGAGGGAGKQKAATGIAPASPGGDNPPEPRYATPEEHAAVARAAWAKFRAAPKPTRAEAKAAKAGIKAAGSANAYRRKFVGNTADRAARKKKMLEMFGDGHTCPCVYCGLRIGDTPGSLEQDKLYTTAEGGRYGIANVIPACGDCNKQRSDMPFPEAMERVRRHAPGPKSDG